MGRGDSKTHHEQPYSDHSLLDANVMAILVIDTDKRVHYCNHRGSALFEVDREKAIGQCILDVVDAQWAALLEPLLERVTHLRQGEEIDCRRVRADGTIAVYYLSVSPVETKGEPATGTSIFIQDVTSLVSHEEQAGHIKKMQALGRMAGNIAHHFNNILGSAVTSLDFARSSNDIRTLRRAITSTADVLGRATRLLNGLLAFAEADYRDSDMADLTETVLYFVEQLTPRLKLHRIELEVKLSPIPVKAVPQHRFFTVLSNLARNAIEALPEGGLLKIELDHDDSLIRCRMIDSGMGMSHVQLEHAFEPFYSSKSPDDTTSSSSHTGLGLSVALGIVRELGGDIVIHSVESQSTMVEIQLPL